MVATRHTSSSIALESDEPTRIVEPSSFRLTYRKNEADDCLHKEEHYQPSPFYTALYKRNGFFAQVTLSIWNELAEQGAAVHFKRLVRHLRHSRQLIFRPTRSRVLVQGDTEKNVLPGIPESAVCVRKFDDSLNSAIRKTYRSLLRSSSLWEPRYPLLRVVRVCF